MPHPFADLGTCIVAELGAVGAVTVRRKAAGAWNQATGLYVEGAESSELWDAVVQPSTPKEIERLPENLRTREAITLFTRDRLLTSDVSQSEKPDLVIWDGRTWEVQISEDWTAQAQYARAVATRVGV